MSATFESDLFGQYFAVPIRDRLEPAIVLSVEGKAYNVSEYYADDLTKLGEVIVSISSKISTFYILNYFKCFTQ
jgi:HrpA-like RNA helicase